ncbi:beta-ketoacyl synthase N-terminal-like domain-containing protein [Streptomyces sp. TRM76323]|uniref:Beta-ketoacyl synthase N-terminal-like domain-containing protein n=1 Tax=Streptomyces tamarix TaxID=3078565 RepID=A0ABU3QIP5_9ACTN|nr:polyketide synthase [Streptomyces tamarix]MDT9682378.1 beta-ketoacyl synthase N-terminal-like domain-containing protein [Streptomyces tamarix]
MPSPTHASDPAETDRRLARDPIAVIGMAGRFPKAGDVQEFWDNIVKGRDCSDTVPESWWRTDLHYDPDPFAEDKTYCQRGGFLTPEVFDPREFGMPPNTLDSTGLVQLLSLVVAKETLRDAGRGRAQWYDPARAGVVLGVCGANSTLMPLAARLLAPQMAETMINLGTPEEKVRRIMRTLLAALPSWTEDSFPGVLGNIVSGRVANRLDLRAANHTVDAACASSLTALRSAVDELVGRRADLMLTGGCDTDNTVVSFLCFSKTPALSLSGRVRPFDADADGTLIGEGVGMVALKRLADAERDGDRIYAVLRGLGSSSDGRGQSIYAPCGTGQLTALRRAYEDADCPPQSVELIEAHGTGTRAGDEVELTALNELLADPDDRRHTAVGSVKSQIGHAKAAAGAAGLIKAVLALHHKVLPPTINVRTPNPQAAREDGALYVNTVTRPWIRDPARTVRRAGVSAFGFGGVNYHAVLEEYTGDGTRGEPERPLHDTPRIHLWHAPDISELLHALERGDAPQQEPPPAGHARVGFVAADAADYADLLALAADRLRGEHGQGGWSHPRGVHFRPAALPTGTKTAVLFPGQGSQYVDMGRHAALALPPVRRAFDEANALFPAGDNLARTVFPAPGTAEPEVLEARLRRTAYAQSAIGALSMGQYRWLRELGLAPDGVLGHSFGELTALWAAGALTDEGFTALARARGLAMEPPAGQDADAGAMAAVRMPAEDLTQALAGHPELVVCNRNAPDEHAVGGPTAAVRAFTDRCAAEGFPARLLPVAAAFHTAYVRHAVDAFAEACSQTDFTAPRIPVYAGTAGARYGRGAAADRRTLAEQLREPVDFAARLEQMYADGIRVFVECGPGQTLTGLVRRTLGDRGVETIACDAGPRADSCAALQQAALRLAVLGLPLTGFDRYARPTTAARPTPSKLARVLDGPNFATVRLQQRYEQQLARAVAEEEQDRRPPEQGHPAHQGEVPVAPVAVQETDPLARAAADHLAAHTRYLDSQLRTAEQLTGLLAERPLDEALAAAISTVTDHCVALGESHARAGEAVAAMLRLPHDGRPSTGADTDAEPVAGPAPDQPPAPLGPRRGEPAARTTSPAADAASEPPKDPARSALAQLWAAERSGQGLDGEATMDIGEVDPEELEEAFRRVVAEKTGYDIDMIEPDMYLQEDLGIDSLKQVEIGAEMWRRYPVIGRTDMYRLSEARTVRQLEDMLHEVITTRRPRLLLGTHAPQTGRVFVTLRDLPPADVCVDAFAPGAQALLLDDGGDLPGILQNTLVARGWEVRRLSLPGAGLHGEGTGTAVQLADWGEEVLASTLGEALDGVTRLDLCVLPVSRTADTDADTMLARLRHAVLVVKHTRPLLEAAAADGTRAGLVTVTRLDGALGYSGTGGDTLAALAGGLGGLVKTLAVEATTLFCRAVDLAPGLPDGDAGEAFAAELCDIATDVREIGVDAKGRRTPIVSADPPPQPAAPDRTTEFTDDDLLLVTGGAGGVTAWCVQALAAESHCGYLLLGRTPLEPEPEWAHGLTEEELRAVLVERARQAGEDPEEDGVRNRLEEEAGRFLAQRGIRSCLDALRAHGAEAAYVSADVRDADAVSAALAPYASRITGVVHGAGVLRDRSLSEVTAESVTTVIDTKLAGLHTVLGALDTDRLRHLVLFSSVAGIWGNIRQADYTLANESLNRFGCAFQAAHPRCRVLPLAWGPWAGGMAGQVHEMFTEIGVPILSREDGCAHFLAATTAGAPTGTVTVIGPTAPLHHRQEHLPAGGLTAHRSLRGLTAEPVLRDHSFGGVPVLPMTAAVGWALHAVERAHGGYRPVVECRDVRITRGLALPDGHEERFRFHLAPGEDPADVRVTVHDTTERGRLRYEGSFRLAERPGEPPRLDVPAFAADGDLHPGYADGRLFHGPALRGLREVLVEEPGRFVVAARMPDPPFAKGAYAGLLYSPALSDLLLQGGLLALLRRTDTGDIPMPVSVGRLELFAPLPDDEPFAVDVEIHDGDSPFFSECTLTGCAADGRVLQRWHAVRALWAAPDTVVHGMLSQADRTASTDRN